MSISDTASEDKGLCLVCHLVFSGSMSNCPCDGGPLTPLKEVQIDPETVPGYIIQEEIGSGASGRVYRAQCPGKTQNVAIKILHRSLLTDLDLVKRFQLEAQLNSRLSSRHVVAIESYGLLADGRPYIVMDYIEGQTLDRVIVERGAMAIEKALPLFVQIALGLSHIHARGIMHRDIKSNNIMLIEKEGQPDRIKIVDFGIAKGFFGDSGDTSVLTQAGQAIGSPHYMSPEQCIGQVVDHRTDIYSLGVVMYETLTGCTLFSADDAVTVMQKHLNERPAAMHLPPENSEVERIVFKALSKKPEDRYQNADQLLADLGAYFVNAELQVASTMPAPLAIPLSVSLAA